MLIKLTEEEKTHYCILLGEHLKRLRNIICCTQENLAGLSGISKERISRMENGLIIMRWSQFINFIMLFSMNTTSKEYLYATKIITPRLLQALQVKDAQVPPDMVVPVSETLVQEFNTDFKIVNSLSLKGYHKKK